MGNLIKGPCDLDRATFLAQDAYFTHSGQALIDPTVVVEKMGIVERDSGLRDLCLFDLPFAEGFVLARELMYHNIYLATPKLIAETMLIRALFAGLNPSLTFEEFQLATDEKILSKLHQSRDSFVKKILRMLSNRIIYEVIHEQSFNKLKRQVKKNLREIESTDRILDFENQVRQELPRKAAQALRKNDFFIIVSLWKSPETSEAWIKEADRPPKTLSAVSPLLKPTQYQRYIESREKIIIAIDPDKDNDLIRRQLVRTTLRLLRGAL